MIQKEKRLQGIWTKKGNFGVRIGLTKDASSVFSEVSYIELPKVGDTLQIGEIFLVVETCKAVYDIESELSGKVVLVNQAICKTPSLLHTDPEGEGWLLEIS